MKAERIMLLHVDCSPNDLQIRRFHKLNVPFVNRSEFKVELQAVIVNVRDDDLEQTGITHLFQTPLVLDAGDTRNVEIVTNALGDGNYDIETIETRTQILATEEPEDEVPHTD